MAKTPPNANIRKMQVNIAVEIVVSIRWEAWGDIVADILPQCEHILCEKAKSDLFAGE